ncbi:MAG: 2-hydroxy-3-oxopropionate reductase [Chloroflexi bacterium RBG_13_68_17]|nr:MAG: 2-hydroxy-3-oxopropionate reductase [Chloroflexi bacterium RBG_13_68_17]
MPPTIGFIGLGIMGRPMAANLARAGYALVVLDRHPERVEMLAGMGAQRAATPAEAAARSDLVITMLPDSPDVEAVALGEQGLLTSMRPGCLYIDMSSIAPAVAVRLAQAGRARSVRVLDAPVSGGDVGAQNASLSIMVGGDEADFAEALPILQRLGKKIVHCGVSGAGQVVKVCNQILVAVTIAGVAEALTLGRKAGVEPSTIVEVLGAGLARCGVLENRGPRMVEHDFTPGFRSRLHAKDLRNALASGRTYQVPLPTTALVHDLFESLVQSGRGDLDHTSLLALMEEQAGL